MPRLSKRNLRKNHWLDGHVFRFVGASHLSEAMPMVVPLETPPANENGPQGRANAQMLDGRR